MCRFIVYHGPEINMASLVIDPAHSMLQLAQKAHCHITPINMDGFGLSWYLPKTSPVPRFYKDTLPAYRSADLKSRAREITSPNFFAHVRAASQGGITLQNCHPWVYKNISFMHNGTLPYFKKIKDDILARVSKRAAELIKGTTDSETMFALFITNFEREIGQRQDAQDSMLEEFKYTKTKQDQTESMVSALKTTLRQLHYLVLQHEYTNGIQTPAEEITEDETGGASDEAPLPASSETGRLNFAVSDGQTTCTCRYVTSAPRTAHTLYYSTGSSFDTKQCLVVPNPAGVKPSTVIVSSEPLSSGYNCQEVPVNHMVVSGPNSHFAIEPCA